MIINEKDFAKQCKVANKNLVFVDITSFSDWWINVDTKQEDNLFDEQDYPTLMNPFDIAVWKIGKFQNNPFDIFVVSETIESDGLYYTNYDTFYSQLNSDYAFQRITIICNRFGKSILQNESEIVIKLFNTPFTEWAKEKLNDQFEELSCSIGQIKATLHAINLIHCKNIELVDEPLTRQQQRRKKRKAETIYKVLAIKEGDKSYRYLEHGHNGSKKALHLCRGHFRTYTDDAPLFGRVTGTFWIPAHVKGAKEHGEVVKNYKVVPATN